MLYVTVLILFFMYLLSNVLFFDALRSFFRRKRASLADKQKNLEALERTIERRYKELERKMHDAFVVFEVARDISPLLEKKRLFDVFSEKVKEFGGLSDIHFTDIPQDGYRTYAIKTDSPKYVNFKTTSNRVREYADMFIHQLNLCLERIDLYKKLQELSIHDALTGTYNRRYLMERFGEEFERSKKFTLPLSFLMVDLDFFKKVNDSFGHIVGDVVLREVAKMLTENVREIDFVARYGGEEFALILTETSKDAAIMVAKRIVERIAHTKIKAFDEVVHITVSIGLASFPGNTEKSDMLIEIADKALYQAKSSGRNTVSWF